MLRAHNLYPEEASAMVETWRDSWFEEGTRLLYVVPRRLIDRVLALEINPLPKDVVRVFVARTELFTPDAEREVASALIANDAATLGKYGRFLEAIGRRVAASAGNAERRLLEQRLERAYVAAIVPDRCPTSAGITP